MKRHLPAALIFAILPLVLTWPLILHLHDSIPGDGAGDNVAFLWNFWWMRHALAGPDSVFHTGYLFYPSGADLVLHTHTAFNAWLGATIFSGLSIVEAQNVVILLTYALNGFMAYTLACRVAQRRSAAVVAGILFMSAPFFAAHLHGHFNLIAAWPLPLFLLTLVRDQDSPSTPNALLAGLVLGLTAYIDYYFCVYLLAALACTLVFRGFHWQFTPRARRRFDVFEWALAGAGAVLIALAAGVLVTGGGVVRAGGTGVSMTSARNLGSAMWTIALVLLIRHRRLAVRVTRAEWGPLVRLVVTIAAVAAVLMSPLLWHGVELWRQGNYVTQASSWKSMPGGIDLLAPVLPSPFHPLWGDPLMTIYRALQIDTIENLAWVGGAALVLLVTSWRRLRDDGRAHYWIALGALFFVWALGPWLTIGGVNTGAYLPEGLTRLIPIVSNARIPGRAFVMVYVSLAMLCSLALAGRTRHVSMAVALALVLDFISAPFPLYRLPLAPEIYDVITRAAGGAVLELPTGIRDGFGSIGGFREDTLWFQTIHEKPIVGGFIARLPISVRNPYLTSPTLGTLIALSEPGTARAPVQAASPESTVAWMREANIRFVVVDRTRASETLLGYVARMQLRPIASEGSRVLFAVE